MMAQQVPRTDKVRVKVYELRDNDWFDLGTGFCQTTFSRSEDGSENPRILVQAEEDPDKVLLNTKIQKENMFSKQQESLIVWLEPESGLDMALSFQEAEGSATIWDYVQNVLDSSTEDMTQNLPKPRAEVLGEVTEGPKTGTYGLVGEALAETLGGVGSKAQDVKAEIKMDVDNKSGDGKDALFLSFDTDGGLDAQSDFGPPHEAESVDKTEQPSQTEPPTLLSKEATQSITDLTLGYIKSYILGVRDEINNAILRLPSSQDDEKFSKREDELLPLACPFFQRDRLHNSFQLGRWKLCTHGSWNNYHRVREHVYRKHILPTNHCDRCFKDLKDAQALLQHRSHLQCEQTAILYITADRIPLLGSPMKRGIKEFEKWKTMYRILFPKDIDIPSPYKDVLPHSAELQTKLDKIKEIMTELIKIMELLPHSAEVQTELDKITELQTELAKILELPHIAKIQTGLAKILENMPKYSSSDIVHSKITQIRENTGSVTDSGYASLPPLDDKGSIQKVERNEDQHFHSNASDINYTNLLDNENQCMDDASSIYTTGPNIPPSKKDAYISLLADDLLNKVLTEKPAEDSLDRIFGALPRYLKTFAMKVGSSDSALVCRDVMIFVRRYRNEIANSMRENYTLENNVRSDILGDNTAGMDLGDLISNWDLNTDLLQDPNTALSEKPDDVMDDSHYDNLDEADRATDSLPELSAYRDFISKHSAYEWLLQSIQRELYMGASGNVQTNIRETILGYLPKAYRVSRREAPKRYILTFTADWDLASFLQDQEYRESPERSIERAITITGSKIDAQAATTLQYLSQTWPSYGVYLLHIVKHVVRDTHNIAISYNLPDGTQLKSWPRGPEFKLEVTGTAESIAEIGEQLAWLGSALRPSPYETGAAVVGAFVSDMGIISASSLAEGPAPTYFCNINFEFDMIDDAGEKSNGQCWHQLFRNPVIVKGYPIPRRPMSDMGLEMSLDTMANLVGTHHINTFHNKIFIKGFSAMLIPTRCSDNILLWHSFCKKNGDRVSYLDGKDLHAEDISLHQLETSRHILGWSSSVKYLVGSADANYNISSSWFRRLDENCKLDGASISKGRLIKSTHEAAIGKREKPAWIIREPYRKRLNLLSQKYMVLWDVGCKRGWLVNGVNALLHLLRASLEFNKTNEPPSEFLFQSDMFKEADVPYTVSAAREVLRNPANLDMELYEEDEEDESGAKIKFRVRDRVNELFEVLEKAIDYQRMIADNRKEEPKSAPRKDLEGWNFKDIATDKDPAYLRLAKVKTAGKGWVDFTRAIEAVFLFGGDFGNLMNPIPENSTCSHWETLPPNKYYLAASAKDLNDIIDSMGGNLKASPPRLTDSLVWHPANMASNIRCDCSTHAQTHCERAQAIWPLGISQPSPRITILSLEDDGAVVFGHSASLGWIWNDFGDPERGKLPLLDEESDDDNSADSGIGSSLRSSTISESQSAGQNIHSLGHEHYKIAIICALPKELMAIRALFDETHQDLPQHESDTNTYALGRLGIYNVVAACLPCGDYGTNAASKVASDIEKSFRAVKWYFVVGIGGGIPSDEHDIRLGDVVVSTGVIQHDMGKVMQKDSKIRSTGFPQRPARSLLTALSSVQSDPSVTHDALEAHIQRILSLRPEYQSPGEDRDRLFPVNSKHNYRQKTCGNCKGPPVPKKPRPPGPHIHYGLIASGNQVIKDAATRDRIGAEMNVLCFEMEGAGVMATGNCLVIRGICDYADSHKNDDWHKYAAATAAAYTKFFLLRIRNLDMQTRDVVQIQKRSVSNLEEEEAYLGKRARYHRGCRPTDRSLGNET